MLYRFSEAEVEMLLGLALANAAECATEYDSERAGDQFDMNRDDFLTACRIVAELHEPLADGAKTIGLSDDDMREAARAEGIDLEREIGVFDPRALQEPKCVHGLKFSVHCAACTPPAGSAYAHKIGEVEQAAIDAALIERRRVLLAGAGIAVAELPETGHFKPGTVVDLELERVPAKSVMHRDSCPVAHEHFIFNPALPDQCTCDFGRRLADELGIPYGIEGA